MEEPHNARITYLYASYTVCSMKMDNERNANWTLNKKYEKLTDYLEDLLLLFKDSPLVLLRNRFWHHLRQVIDSYNCVIFYLKVD